MTVLDLRSSEIQYWCSLHRTESAKVTELELSDCLIPYACRPFFEYLNNENVDRNIPKDRGEIRKCWYDEIAALPGFLKHLGLHPLQLVRGECKF